jgi:hypothetical protein
MWGSVFTRANYAELFSQKLADTGFDIANIAVILVSVAIVCAVNALSLRRGDDMRVALRSRPWISY